MPDQQVPWALGRRALVLDVDGEWYDGTGVRDGEEKRWGQRFGNRWAMDGAPTALLPHQCPRCFEVGTHADGCMVAANLARGVPEFWAPWAMWKDPAELPVGIRLFHLDPENPPNGGFYLCDVVAVIPGRASRLALVAIGPEGPTLAPWGTP